MGASHAICQGDFPSELPSLGFVELFVLCHTLQETLSNAKGFGLKL